jgi:hypothetical protein
MNAVTTQPVPPDGNNPQESPLPELPAEQIAYDVPHAAEVLDLSVRKMWHLVRVGKVDSFLLGGNRRIHRDALIKYIDSHRRAA